MTRSSLLLIGVALVVCSEAYQYNVNGTSGYMEGTVYITGTKQAKFVPGKMAKDGDAYGFYNNSLMTSGWGVLEIKAGYNEHTQDNDLMFAAGYLEGIFTANQIWLHYNNLQQVFVTENKNLTLNPKFKKFFITQEAWSRNMVTKYASSDPFWRNVGYVLAHLDGLYAGFKAAADKSWNVSRYIVQFLNAVGDLIDLQYALAPDSIPDFSTMSPTAVSHYMYSKGHCSALVKVTGAYEKLFMSHSSWFAYMATMRIYKHYHFNIKDSSVMAKEMSFSSYPGFLESLDDFYLLGSKMVLLQTTNQVFEKSLYKLVTAESLLAWQRVRVANSMANSGQDWYQQFKKYNSGTYNNQYMVIDLKKIELQKAVHDDALWVVEQIPGLVEGADQSPILRTGYWPSYNVPFYETVYNRSGYPKIVEKIGLEASYQLAPRAKIFRRDQATVTDMASMKHIMRYNDYKEDAYSKGDPCKTICCRGDLAVEKPSPNGCYDTKVADYSMALDFKSFAINGPTLGDNLEPFAWTGSFSQFAHEGLPNVYNFGWETMEPQL